MIINKLSTITHYYPLFIKDTLFSGQSFRWDKISGFDGFYISFIRNMPVVISSINDGSISIYSSDDEIGETPLTDVLRTYLTLDIDNRNLFGEGFIKQYPEVAQLLKEYSGLKLLRQEPFETTITFMCAQGIGMTLIRRQIALLCEKFGSPCTIEFRGQKHRLYRFPDAECLAEAPLPLLQACTNNNYRRAVNIRRVAGAAASGLLDFGELGSGELPLDRLREQLCDFDGIGPKIADCIALFGLGRFDAFPIDTHVRQYLAGWFGIRRASDALTEKNYLRLQEEIRTILKPELAGYAGHLLFHCWRRKVRHLRTA
ncbi:MAG: Fe-S cluster assembly protein HesB [Chlorobium sp.]|uniref:DNA-3-methyladenine glycosylase family protein n=1 Tax=Chlorobium sp. TaxID=1095 RepID=UPI0025BDE0DA|nr:DNA glycosylase [Chlorobium sp.]MCF8382398.1 Fe-S cluster assembly protein HesB [Chlorobium sp.]